MITASCTHCAKLLRVESLSFDFPDREGADEFAERHETLTDHEVTITERTPA
ncbi:hypothetical protein M2272_005899 [Mycobacterium frederiksbergense]|uniref:Uncharacterized protein n=1 Tax=Mycolicibacterium frederiksbergense TaxID=117567 RepID=A0ABT6L9E6_9MYCO|nr:hypothetical protein [Mycolicibacterium frederiksbergense]